MAVKIECTPEPLIVDDFKGHMADFEKALNSFFPGATWTVQCSLSRVEMEKSRYYEHSLYLYVHRDGRFIYERGREWGRRQEKIIKRVCREVMPGYVFAIVGGFHIVVRYPVINRYS